jgi:predicted kinase
MRLDRLIDHHLAMGGAPWFLVVSGPPASGKSTIAPLIAEEFALPLIAKDTIKDALMESLPVADVEVSRRLGRAAVRAMLAVAAASPVGAVLESNLYRSVAGDELSVLPGRVIELFCRCSEEIAEARYRQRAGTRNAGHFDQIRTRDELWNDEVCEPVAGGWPVIEVDTNDRVDLPTLARRIRELTDG